MIAERVHAIAALVTKAGGTKKKRGRWIVLIVTAVLLVNPCTLAIFIRVVLYEAFEMDGPSMAPGYQHGDRVYVAKFPFGLFLPFTDEAMITWGEPELGDVLIVHSPLDDIDIIKRVIGLPGDTIEIRDDVIVRNGVAVRRRELGQADEGAHDDAVRCVDETVEGRSWTILEHDYEVTETIEPVTVPEGHVYVLGDNRHRSNDSRNPRVGFIPIARIKGRVDGHYLVAPDRIECPGGEP